jgi:hypothetical protein
MKPGRASSIVFDLMGKSRFLSEFSETEIWSKRLKYFEEVSEDQVYSPLVKEEK